MAKVEALALQVAAEHREHGEAGPIDAGHTSPKSDHR
jgi:hypothetical protein